MLKLYYAPGACSTASHIGLEESGAKFEGQALVLRQERAEDAGVSQDQSARPRAGAGDRRGHDRREHRDPRLRRGKYAPQLMPKDPVQRARAISLMAWFSNTVHPAFTHIGRPERFATDPAVFDHLKATGRDNFHAALKEIDGILAGKQWILGDAFSVVDGYALVFYGWGKRIGLPVEELKNYTAWKDRMLARPAVQRVLEREQNVLVRPEAPRSSGTSPAGPGSPAA